ncbi:hypothetical protein TKV_c15390 [Thermoanaerobacter kivui]|jgi:uncharacterized protein YlxW (UPF0749 family)|uniref:Division initiation protein n=1 Tax=Thermoanaerobacter kivui TaxID=2325 RepID=A0A097ASB3_THEKI|nr:DUF881 domain-containing protein [Thermoanaerobacter kivui]AIS52704.1 hypothetical protein TKV_c15390 [Thermoanaerobacter kivui]
MKKSVYISVAFVCIVLGIMLSTQFRIVKKSGAVTVQRAEELAAQLKEVQLEKEALLKQINELEAKINSYEEASSKTSVVTQALKNDVEKYKALAGLTDLQGPGVIVTINDSKQAVPPGQDPNLFLVHDEDLLKVANELRAAGAEAISLNDQRLIATSEIRCVGPTVNVNSVRFAAPYVFKAIGDPDTLEAALKLKGGVVETLSTWGIEVNIKKSDKIIIKKYDGVIKFRYAKPVVEGENK